MKEILKKYYNLDDIEYKYYDEGIVFSIDGVYYYLYKSIYDEKTTNLIVNKYINISFLHRPIRNIYNNYISEGYCLLKMNVLIYDISEKDIELFDKVNVELLQKYISMNDIWESRIDYIERQVNEMSNDSIINYSYNYFVGIAEILLKLLRNYNLFDISFSLVHIRFDTLSSIDFYNPFNLIIDLKYRDLMNYVKLIRNEEMLISIIDKINKNSYQYFYCFVRLVFPFTYFKNVNSYILDKNNIKKISTIVDNNTKYEQFINKMQKLFGIKVFLWLKG